MGFFDFFRRQTSTQQPPIALGLEVVAVGTERTMSRDQVGGIPTAIDTWPCCDVCEKQLTFVAQLACGPGELIRYPDTGSIAIFLCGSPARCICDGDGPPYAVFFTRAHAANATSAGPTLERSYRVERKRLVDGWDRRCIELATPASWIQGPPVIDPCGCGALMACIAQFDEFDPAIKMLDGRAYVFGCVARCGDRSFRLYWQNS